MGWKLSGTGAGRTCIIRATAKNNFLVTSIDRKVRLHIPVPTDTQLTYRCARNRARTRENIDRIITSNNSSNNSRRRPPRSLTRGAGGGPTPPIPPPGLWSQDSDKQKSLTIALHTSQPLEPDTRESRSTQRREHPVLPSRKYTKQNKQNAPRRFAENRRQTEVEK